jgi:hypothetical protein
VTGGGDIGPIRGYVWAVVFSFAFYAVGINIAFVLWVVAAMNSHTPP